MSNIDDATTRAIARAAEKDAMAAHRRIRELEENEELLRERVTALENIVQAMRIIVFAAPSDTSSPDGGVR